MLQRTVAVCTVALILACRRFELGRQLLTISLLADICCSRLPYIDLLTNWHLIIMLQ